MLQSGGGNNTSAKLLRQYFSHEAKCEEHARRAAQKSGGSPRGNRTGILPVITANTDIASLRRSRRSNAASQSPRSARNTQQPAYPLPYELPKQGIGYKVEDVAPEPVDAINLRAGPSHGRLPPYGRRAITKEFYDTISGGGIACLYPQQQQQQHSTRLNTLSSGQSSPRQLSSAA
jgi:hypothetical protein